MPSAYDFAINTVLNENLIALFPDDEGCLCYVTWGHPLARGVVGQHVYSADPRRRALAAVALTYVARKIHAGAGV
jgi:uncharacterized protein (DUF2237 family)